MNVKTMEDLARAYYKEWVKGDAKPEPTATARKNFLSMYKQATGYLK